MTSLPADIDRLDSIRNLHVVSNAKHLHALTDFDPARDVIVSGNFLVFEMAKEQGMMAAPYDAGLMFSDLGDVIKTSGEARIRGSDWFFDGNKDLTAFNGISLGRQFLIQSLLALRIRNHIHAALTGWKLRFVPETIVVYGFECGFPRNSRINQIDVLVNAAKSLEIKVDLRVDQMVKNPLRPSIRERWLTFRNLYSTFLGLFMNSIQFMSGKSRNEKPRVLIICTHLNTLPLLERIDDLPFQPVLIGERFPNQRNLQWVYRCIRKGAKTVFLRGQPLNAHERAALERIRRVLHDYWDSGRCKAPLELIQFARDTIVDGESFVRAAELTKTAGLLLKDAKADIILTDALSNTLYNAVLSHAKNLGLPIAATWHAPMFHDVQSYTLGSDPRSSSIIDVVFNWGVGQDIWLKRINAQSTSVLTGTMLTPVKSDAESRSEAGRNVLMLEYAFPATDVTYRPSLSKQYFKDFCAMLNRAGYKVRFKMHPSNDDISEYSALAMTHGLDCEFVTSGLLTSHLGWADLVIGPGHSGAMLETLMVGRPYYPVLFQPHGIWSGYFADLKVFDNVEELRQALEKPYAFPREFLQMWTSDTTISDPVMETARAISNTIRSHRSELPGHVTSTGKRL